MKWQYFLFFAFFFSFSAPQVLHQSEIDARLSDENQALIYKETRIVLVLTNFSLEIKNCNDKLKSVNVKNDLLVALDNYVSLIQQLKTLKSYKTYENISTCGDINRKITLLDFDERKTRSIMSKIIVNITSINKANADVVTAYNINLRNLGYLSANERSVLNVIKQTSSLIAEYLDYNRILVLHISKLLQFKTFLTVFKKNYCKCLTTVAWTGSNSTLELNIQLVEDKLIAEEKKLINLTSIALTKVKSTSLSSLQNHLNSILTTSDYSKITWPNIKNCNDFWLRLKFLQFKQLQYLGVYQSASLNYSKVISSRSVINLNTATQTVKNAINATMAVETRFTKYTSLLIYSIVKMARMIADFNGFGDTFCSCEIESIATTTIKEVITSSTTVKVSTTTTVKHTTTSTTVLTTTIKEPETTSSTKEPTTTTKEPTKTTEEPKTTTEKPTTNSPTTTTTPPCGTFVLYDTINAINAPELYGLEGGMNQDGITKQYVGYGNAAGCGQTECPGYINTITDSAGCYMACGSLLYDGKTSFYLLNHPDLMWILTDTTAMRTLPGTIPVVGTYPYLFGRIKYNGQWTLGKIHNGGSGGHTFYIQTGSSSSPYYNGFEVLTCTPPTTTTSTTTTSTTTIPTTTTILPCGTFMPYDTMNAINAPELTGFEGGVDQDETTKQYVGYGDANQPPSCSLQPQCPGIITTVPSGPGCYMTCGGMVYDAANSYYLINHPDLEWVLTDITAMRTLPGAISIGSDTATSMPFLFGRMKQNGLYTLGKVHNGAGSYIFYMDVNGQSYGNTSGFEVLTCRPPTTTTSTTTTTTTETPCGTYALYDPVNARDLTNLGFPSGTFYDGSTIFPGHLGIPVCGQTPGPSQIITSSVHNGPGGYMVCGGTHFDNTTAKYLQYHPKLKWVETTGSAAASVPGAISLQSGLLMYFGRLNFTWPNGTFSLISKIYPPNLWYHLPLFSSEKTTSGALEVLTCQP